jgi:hypothetical protein
MRVLIVLLTCLVLSIPGYSQKPRSDIKKNRELKLLEKKKGYNALGTALEKRKFILEMEYILNESGTRKRMNQMLTYIMIDSTRCVWESEYSDIFTDLMKTVTKAEGRVDDWKMTKDSGHLSYFLQFKMFTDNGLFYVTTTINSNYLINGTISGTRDRLTFYGRVVIH